MMREFSWNKKHKLVSIICLCAAVAVSGISFALPSSAEVFAQEIDSGFSSFGQEESAFDPTEKEVGYSSVLYDNTNGLPTSEANAIAETSEGFIWIGSYSGLIRYDGSTFERMDSTSGISSVVSLYVDSLDRLWIGTNDSGAAVMEKGRMRVYNRSDGLPSLSVKEIQEDSSGNIYLATTQGIAVIGNDMELHTVSNPLLNVYIRAMVVGKDDVLYGITANDEIFTIQNGRLTGYYNKLSLDVPDSYAILPDPDRPGYVWIGTKHSGIYYGHLGAGFETESTISVEPLEYINSMRLVNGKMWICADNGIGAVGENGFEVLSNIPLNSSVERLMTDYQGNMWFTSSKQGVMKIAPSRFTDVFEQYALPTSVVYTTCMYDDMLFIGGKDDGLTVLGQDEVLTCLPLTSCVTASGKDLGQTDLIEMLRGIRIRSIIADSRDRLWISTYGDYALVRYHDGEAVCFTPEDGMPSDRMRAVCERHDGSIMVACSGGLVLLDNEKVTQVYDSSSGISNLEILTASEAKNGDMLIGTDGDGIYVIGKNGIYHIGIDQGLPSEVVMRIIPDRERELYWIVTSNAIAYMDSVYNVTAVSSFPYSNNFDMYENSKGDMWILSSNGVYVAATYDLIRNEEISPLYYNRSNGLSCIASANSYSALTEDGDLYIAGTTGVSKVNIEHPFEDVRDIKIVVPYVEADERYIYPDANGVFNIPHDVRKLTIYSYVYNYSLSNPYVTFWLEGFETGRNIVDRSSLVPVDYTNLRGGTYNFIMELNDPAGSYHQESSVRIVKEKAFNETIWFNLLCLAAGLMLLSAFVRVYLYRKTIAYQKKEQEQKTLIREITEAFARTVDMKDKYTNGHSTRVADYTVMLTRELGYDEDTVEKYYNIALLHDIGKIGVPSEVLNKPGKLNDEEYEIIKSHSAKGYNVLKDIHIMPELALGAGSHHERPDGKGYPNGLKEEEIPRVAQIIAVADTFDAMYSTRPYRSRMNFEKAVSIIKEVRGTQLTADVVDAFLRLVEKGEFRAPDDNGSGSMEDINNIHKKYEQE